MTVLSCLSYIHKYIMTVLSSVSYIHKYIMKENST